MAIRDEVRRFCANRFSLSWANTKGRDCGGVWKACAGFCRSIHAVSLSGWPTCIPPAEREVLLLPIPPALGGQSSPSGLPWELWWGTHRSLTGTSKEAPSFPVSLLTSAVNSLEVQIRAQVVLPGKIDVKPLFEIWVTPKLPASSHDATGAEESGCDVAPCEAGELIEPRIRFLPIRWGSRGVTTGRLRRFREILESDWSPSEQVC